MFPPDDDLPCLFPGLNELDGRHLRRISEPSPTLPVPQTTLYGSHGIPLHEPAKANIISVRINLTQFHLGVGGTPCSLEAMGIVPTRSLGRTKFGSLVSLRVSFKSHYPSSTHQNPVVIRGVAPTSPAAVTQQLHPGTAMPSLATKPLSLCMHTLAYKPLNLSISPMSWFDTILALFCRRHHFSCEW